jgi:hypothetical protein
VNGRTETVTVAVFAGGHGVLRGNTATDGALPVSRQQVPSNEIGPSSRELLRVGTTFDWLDTPNEHQDRVRGVSFANWPSGERQLQFAGGSVEIIEWAGLFSRDQRIPTAHAAAKGPESLRTPQSSVPQRVIVLVLTSAAKRLLDRCAVLCLTRLHCISVREHQP